ncbi:MAG: apolipoprotein N-acyltransferase [Ilumatobacteraceae bacterium]|nr:apolipoprotein N-acyltransferase [Acidimicrobiales bacterium]MCB9396110.1 apolipoprotein N-acyltransferase [Acidimicrobiaceae bacterium]
MSIHLDDPGPAPDGPASPAAARRTRERVAPVALALGAGALVALSLPPWGFWPLAIVGVVLFEVSLGEHPTTRQRLVRGFAFGAGWLFPGMGWMWFLTAPGYLVVGLMFAGLHALAAAVAPTGPWRVIGRPVAHTLVEALRLVVPFGGVPLATLAIGQAGGPLLGVARVGGVILLTWLVFQLGFALAGPSPYVPKTMRQRRGARAAWHGAAAFGAVVVVLVLAAVAPEGTDTGRTLRIAVVQGGGPQGTHAIDTRARDVVDRHLAATASIEPGTVDLVVWPENVIDVATFVDSVERVEIATEAARIGAPFAVGITEDVPPRDADDPGAFLNAQVVVDVDGEVISRYEKVQRVPYGEYVPLRGVLEAIGAPVDQIPRDAVAGTGPAVLDLPDRTRVAVAISWEIFFGSRVRDGVDGGGGLVLNPTNGSSYTGTILQTQQVASSRLRAVETGRWVVQAAPTGFSAFVDPDGAVFERTAVSEQAVIVHEVAVRTGTTWAVQLGAAPWWVLVAVVLTLSIVMPRRTRRRS